MSTDVPGRAARVRADTQPEPLAAASAPAPSPDAVVGPARYRDALGSGEFRGLVVAQVLSEWGDQIARVALAALVLRRTDSVFAASAVFAVSFLPAVAGSALLGSLADRLPRRGLLLGCDLGRALIVGLLTALAVPGVPLGVLLGLLLCAELLTRPYDAAQSAVLPDVLPDPRVYLAGAGLQRVLFQADQVVGLVLAGFVVKVLSERAALALDAASFVVSFLVIAACLRQRPAAAGVAATRLLAGIRRDLREGLQLVAGDRVVRALLSLAWCAPLFLVAPEGVALGYARAEGLSSAYGGLLMASIPAGAAVGALVFGRVAPRRQVELMLVVAALGCLPLVATALSPPAALTVALWFLCGLAQAFMVPLMATVNLVTPPAMRGRLNGLAAAGFSLTTVTAFLLVGLLADVTTPATAVGLAGGLGLGVLLALRRGWPVAELRQAADRSYQR